MFPSVPRTHPKGDKHRQILADSHNRVLQGSLNVTGQVTLTASAATTTITDPRLSVYSVVLFDPMTANAAAELAAGTMYALEATRLNGSWVLTHANNAQTDRKFRYIVLGGEGMNYS